MNAKNRFFVYLLETESGLCKIGMTSNLVTRLPCLQRHFEERLIVSISIEMLCEADALDLERNLHFRYWQHARFFLLEGCTSRECFQLSEDDISDAKRYAENWIKAQAAKRARHNGQCHGTRRNVCTNCEHNLYIPVDTM